MNATHPHLSQADRDVIEDLRPGDVTDIVGRRSQYEDRGPVMPPELFDRKVDHSGAEVAQENPTKEKTVMTTTPNTPFDAKAVRFAWRDLADDVTGEQYANFETLEDGGLDPAELVRDAQWLATENHGTRIFFGHLPTPVGATTIGTAANEAVMGGWFRQFHCDAVVVGDDGVNRTEVQIDGTQYADGRIEREIDFLNKGGDEPGDYSVRSLNPQEAREIAVALIAAADRIDYAIRCEELQRVRARRRRARLHRSKAASDIPVNLGLQRAGESTVGIGTGGNALHVRAGMPS